MSLSNFGFTKSSKGVSTAQEIQTEKEKGDEKEVEGDTSATAETGNDTNDVERGESTASTSRESEKSAIGDDGVKSTSYWKEYERKQKWGYRDEWEKEFKWLKRDEKEEKTVMYCY